MHVINKRIEFSQLTNLNIFSAECASVASPHIYLSIVSLFSDWLARSHVRGKPGSAVSAKLMKAWESVQLELLDESHSTILHTCVHTVQERFSTFEGISSTSGETSHREGESWLEKRLSQGKEGVGLWPGAECTVELEYGLQVKVRSGSS